MKTPADGFKKVIEAFDRLEIPYLVGGSVASSVHGIARPTLDADFVAAIREDQIEDFAAELKSDFYADPEMMRQALKHHRCFNLIHYDSSFKYDVFPMSENAFDRSQLGRREYDRTTAFGDEAIECAVASAEDTILAKLRWYRAGGEESERQWNDLRGILMVRREQLDLDYLRIWAPRLGIADLLEKLLNEFSK
jgi:hypothetical protein